MSPELRKSLPTWFATFAGMAALLIAAIHDRPAGTFVSAANPAALSGTWLDYNISRAEWPQAQPSYCDVASRFDLTPRQTVETLYLNGTNGNCADSHATIPYGQSMRIAMAAAPPDRCERQHASLCP